ncbi:hypothetical protein PM082_023325 [Marasmius tenuissimus]|nr:hypothetical protein PM082_023325 [Marasmius tenuissimus]
MGRNKTGDSFGKRLEASLLPQSNTVANDASSSPIAVDEAPTDNVELEDAVMGATWLSRDYDPRPPGPTTMGSPGLFDNNWWDSVRQHFSSDSGGLYRHGEPLLYHNNGISNGALTNLDFKVTITVAVCPQCSFTYCADADGNYPERCLRISPGRPSNDKDGPSTCNVSLLKGDPTGRPQEPVQPHEYHPFPVWLDQLLASRGGATKKWD